MGEAQEIRDALAAALAGEGYTVRQIVPGETVRRVRGDCFSGDLCSAAQVEELHTQIRGKNRAVVGGVINLLGLQRHEGEASAAEAQRMAIGTFHLLKQFEEDLRHSAGQGGGCFINVTGLNGRFGLHPTAPMDVTAASTLGITKTLHREQPKLTVRNVDLDRETAIPLLVSQLLAELSADDELLEVGLSGGRRYSIKLVAQAMPEPLPALPLERESVVLVTGGAYGVTADVAQALARAVSPRLVLVGRSALPGPEAAETAGLAGSALRGKLIEQARAKGERFTPADIERQMDRLLKDRQIRDGIAECQRAGAEVEYHALDVRDGETFGALIEDLYRRFGRIDGVIHGAGVIDDKRIADKTTESFQRVFGTKVDSALTLAQRLRPETLKFLVFFSSVSGRFGNAGQVDYSAANEMLNKLADELDRRWPARVVAVNWGPWDGGMISDDLRRIYEAANIGLIPVAEGIRWLLAQLGEATQASAEVVVSAGVRQMLAGGRKPVHQLA